MISFRWKLGLSCCVWFFWNFWNHQVVRWVHSISRCICFSYSKFGECALWNNIAPHIRNGFWVSAHCPRSYLIDHVSANSLRLLTLCSSKSLPCAHSTILIGWPKFHLQASTIGRAPGSALPLLSSKRQPASPSFFHSFHVDFPKPCSPHATHCYFHRLAGCHCES